MEHIAHVDRSEIRTKYLSEKLKGVRKVDIGDSKPKTWK
jgi:hypothetical protein